MNKRNNKFDKKKSNRNMSNKDIARKLKEDAISSNDNQDPSFNDLSWYVVDEQILNDAARIPYSIPVGMPLTRNTTFVHPGTQVAPTVYPDYDDALPGVLVSHVMPILGNAQSASDPVNVAANSIYQFVRSRISGSRPYDAVDFMIYLGAMDSVFTFCTWLTRLYGTVFTYHQANRYLSRALIEAQGVDYDDFTTNLANFRAGFNLRIAKIKSLYVPSNMSLFVRHAWMFQHYYIEGESEKDQIYCHMPEGIYHYELDSDGAGMLRARPLDYITTGKFTVQNLFNILDYMINPIYADEDFNKISGDLLKAYEGKVFTITEIPDIATVQLKYQPEVLLQFKNAKYLHVRRDGDVFINNAFDYVQDTNKSYLKFTMPIEALSSIREFDSNTNTTHDVSSTAQVGTIDLFAIKMGDWSKPTLLTTPSRDVTPGENMINTRLTLGLHVSADSSSYWSGKIDHIAVGSEWPVRFTIYTFHRNKSTKVISLFHRNYEFAMYADEEHLTDITALLTSQVPIISAFKYHPEIFVALVDWNNDHTAVKFRDAGRSWFEVDNYALIGTEVLEGLHNAAILGQYNVPRLSVSP